MKIKTYPPGLPADSDWNLYYPDVDRDKGFTMLYNAFMWRLSAMTWQGVESASVRALPQEKLR